MTRFGCIVGVAVKFTKTLFDNSIDGVAVVAVNLNGFHFTVHLKFQIYHRVCACGVTAISTPVRPCGNVTIVKAGFRDLELLYAAVPLEGSDWSL
jgi:hypothetical protein